MKKTTHIAVLLLALILAAGCSTDRDPSELFAPSEDLLVVDATLIVDSPFPTIFLSRTLRPDEPFSFDQAAVVDALITVSGGGEEIVYRGDALVRGLYRPILAGEIVRPATTYWLSATTTDGRLLTAATTTPGPLTIDDWVLLDNGGQTVTRNLSTYADHGDSLLTQPENQLVYSQGLLEGRFPAGGLIGIQVALFSRTPNSPLVIDPDFIDEEDLQDLDRRNSSPPLDPENGSVRLPWFAIFYEGDYVIKVFSMDRNWYDLARTDPMIGGGGIGFGGSAGDNFDRPIFHVNGGIGLFGSGAVDSIGVVIHPE